MLVGLQVGNLGRIDDEGVFGVVRVQCRVVRCGGDCCKCYSRLNELTPDAEA